MGEKEIRERQENERRSTNEFFVVFEVGFAGDRPTQLRGLSWNGC